MPIRLANYVKNCTYWFYLTFAAVDIVFCYDIRMRQTLFNLIFNNIKIVANAFIEAVTIRFLSMESIHIANKFLSFSEELVGESLIFLWWSYLCYVKNTLHLFQEMFFGCLI